jgi:thiamine biosynthesis lipoprotein
MRLATADPQAGIHRQVEHVMGMPISLALRGRHAADSAGRAAWAVVIAELREVDAVFSTYRPDSHISRIGRGEIMIADCPAEVAEVIQLGQEAERQSGGAFSLNLPDADGRRRFDPSGVVKGWAVERVARHLRELADTDFCLSAGGDMICDTVTEDRRPWRIGIENPRDTSRLIAVIPVRAGAVATSGTAHRGAHIVDPRTAQPPTGVASVTVIDTSLTWADIDATAAYVHGRDAAQWLQSRPIRSGLVVWADGTTTLVAGHIDRTRSIKKKEVVP